MKKMNLKKGIMRFSVSWLVSYKRYQIFTVLSCSMDSLIADYTRIPPFLIKMPFSNENFPIDSSSLRTSW